MQERGITIEEVRKIAKLAHIAIAEEDLELMSSEMSGILHWINELQVLNTEGIDPLISPNPNNLELHEDIVEAQNQQDVLCNAPKSKYGYFTVPKVIE
jgi:aspartyl-tRNA(Asn)/glutamyl-tRNA(Gln) amidotransferase subunit C